jgi:hypothetical protein
LKRAALPFLAFLLSAIPEILFAASGKPPGGPLFGESYNRIFQQPFYASAALSIYRPGVNRRLLLGLSYRDRSRSFVRVTGSAREMGTIVLRREGRVYLFFPRADLLVNLPPLMGSFPLFGSDFSTDDLLAFADFSSRFEVRDDGEEVFSGVPSYRYRLAPHAATSSPYAEIRLWVARNGRVPLREEFLSREGAVMREVTMESDGRLRFPARWRARTFGPRGGESEIQFRLFERNPPMREDLFTVDGLRQWR